jgi:hypothetical protein
MRTATANLFRSDLMLFECSLLIAAALEIKKSGCRPQTFSRLRRTALETEALQASQPLSKTGKETGSKIQR